MERFFQFFRRTSKPFPFCWFIIFAISYCSVLSLVLRLVLFSASPFSFLCSERYIPAETFRSFIYPLSSFLRRDRCNTFIFDIFMRNFVILVLFLSPTERANRGLITDLHVLNCVHLTS